MAPYKMDWFGVCQKMKKKRKKIEPILINKK